MQENDLSYCMHPLTKTLLLMIKKPNPLNVRLHVGLLSYNLSLMNTNLKKEERKDKGLC